MILPRIATRDSERFVFFRCVRNIPSFNEPFYEERDLFNVPSPHLEQWLSITNMASRSRNRGFFTPDIEPSCVIRVYDPKRKRNVLKRIGGKNKSSPHAVTRARSTDIKPAKCSNVRDASMAIGTDIFMEGAAGIGSNMPQTQGPSHQQGMLM